MRQCQDNIIYCLIGLIIGFLITGSIVSYELAPTSFFDIKLTNILQILITLILGCYIAYQISIRARKEIKKREVVLDMMNNLEDIVVSTFTEGWKYMSDPKSGSNQQVTTNLQNLSKHLGLIIRILSHENSLNNEKIIKKIKYNYFSLKSIMTANFGVKNLTYSATDFAKIDSCYNELMISITEFKIHIFNA